MDLAETVVEAEVFPAILACLKDVDGSCGNAATAIREVAKHTPELAQLIVSNGGVAAGGLRRGEREREPAARRDGAGYIGAFSETLATAVVAADGIAPLYNALSEEPEDHIKSASAWSLGQIGRHTPDHAKAMAMPARRAPVAVGASRARRTICAPSARAR